MMYVGAVEGANPVRPVTVLRMNEGLAARRADGDRRAYLAASLNHAPNRAIDALCDTWGISHTSWYQANSREGLRDETFRAWADYGALHVDHSVVATSSQARYTLAPEFAALLDPALTDDALEEAIATWQKDHLGPIGKSRYLFQKIKGKSKSAVAVSLPDGEPWHLDPGLSSEILKAFIETAAPALLVDPHVIFVSQSGQPVGTVDSAYLESAGLHLSKLKLLPDCLLIDTTHNAGSLWFVEIVATDGPINETRKAALLSWAVSAGVEEAQCRFLTAFESRTASPAKKALSVLARGSYAWYADEPGYLLTWAEI
jgi:hypothetical protein